VTRGLIEGLCDAKALREALARITRAAKPRPPPRAEHWGELRGLGWPSRDGPRTTFFDRAREEVMERDVVGEAARARCDPASGGERLATLPAPAQPVRRNGEAELRHLRAGFALRAPPDWEVHAGADWLLVRSPERDLALEVVSFPSMLAPLELAERARRLLGRARRIEAEFAPDPEPGIADRPAYTVSFRLEVHARETRVRATFVRLDGRVARLIGVAEVEAWWREGEVLKEIEASFRRLDRDRETTTSPP
jgi:hypothetical protein